MAGWAPVSARFAVDAAATPPFSAAINGQMGAPGANVTVVFNPGFDSGTSDDRYTVTYNINGVTYSQVFDVSVSGSDALGPSRGGAAFTNGLAARFFIPDIATSLSGALDFVQIAALERETSATAADIVFLAYGNLTAAADMPTTGTATYKGHGRGIYVTGADLFSTAHDASLIANFGNGQISGTVDNFRFMDPETGTLVNRSENPNFVFTATNPTSTPIYSGTAISVAGGLGISGSIRGLFVGAPGQPPDETGFVYQLGAPGSGPFMNGAAALGKQ